MKTHINQILVNVDLILNQISDILIKLSSGKLGRRIQWATTQRDEMNKFRSSLESNKAAREIALTIGSISMLTQQAQNSTRQNSQVETLLQRTESISLSSRKIDGKLDVLTDMHKDNTRFDKVAHEIENLRAHMTSLATASGNTTLDTFRLNSEAYTQSLLQNLQVIISDSRVAALSEQLSRSTPSPSQIVSCDCENVYKAKQRELEVRFERRIAEYDRIHTENLKVLQERENSIVSLQQKAQQEVDENAKLKTEITTMKRQIKENATIITALRASNEVRESHEQATTVRQKMPKGEMTDPQSSLIQQQEQLNTDSRTSEHPASSLLSHQHNSNANGAGNQVQKNSLRLWPFERDLRKIDVTKELPAALKKERNYRQLDGHNAEVYSVAFSPDGTTIMSGSHDRSIRLWDVVTCRQLQQFDAGIRVYGVAFSPNGAIIAAALFSEGVMLWDVGTGRCLRQLDGQNRKTVCTSVSFSPDGVTIVSTALIIWNVATGKQIRELKDHDGSARSYSVCFSPDGTVIAAGSYCGSVRIWNVATGKQLRQLNAHTGRIFSLAFSPDGTTILSTSPDGLSLDGDPMKIWNVETGTRLRQFEPDQSERGKTGICEAVFSPDGITIASASFDHSVTTWDTTTGKQLRKLGCHKEYVLSVAFSPDGRTIASGSADGSIRLWDVTT